MKTASGNEAHKCPVCHGEQVRLVEVVEKVLVLPCENCDGKGMLYPSTNRYPAACCGRLHPASKLFFINAVAICNDPADCGDTSRRNRG